MEKEPENRQETEPKHDKRLDNLKRDAGPGRPPGQKNYSTLYREALVKLAELNNKTPDDIELEIIQKGLLSARKGDYRFYKDVLDRLLGTATQKTDLTSGGKPINESKIKQLAEAIFHENDKPTSA